MYGLVTTIGPTIEPVDVQTAKLHARIDLDVEDGLVAKWIQSAREIAETHTGRVWVNQTMKLMLPGWPRDEANRHWFWGSSRHPIRLPREPVSSITSVKYYDIGGTLTTLVADTDYQTFLEHSPPLIAPAPFKYWPYLQCEKLKPVEIVFVAGYGALNGWPARAEEAIFLTLTYWNRNRGDDRDPTMRGLPDGAIWLLDSLWTGTY